MISKYWRRSLLAACLLALPPLSGCSDPPPTGPGGGPSSGTTGSTNAPGVGNTPFGNSGSK